MKTMKSPYMSLSKNAFGSGRLVLATALFIAFYSNAIYAQTDKKTTFNEEVVIEKQYKPKLSDAVKIDVVPGQENIDTKKPNIAYKAPAFLAYQNPYKGKLKGLKMDRTPLDELQHGFAKAGFGNYSNLYGELFYNTLRSKNNLLAFQAKHHSGNGPDSNSIFSEQKFGLFGKRIFSGHSISGDLGYQRNANRFYGIMPGDSIDHKDSIKQRFNDIHFSADFARIKADTGHFNYGAGISIYNFADLYKTNETGFGAKLYGIEPFRGNNIRFDASYNYWRYNTAKFSDNRNLVKIGVNYNFNYNGFRALAGFNTANQSDSANSTFHFFPNANMEYDVIEKYLTAYGGITGNVDAVSYKSLARENEFISSIQTLKNTTEKLNLFGGAKGSFSSNSSFNIGLSYRNYRYLPFFVNDSTDTRRFKVAYDSNTTVFNVHAEAGFSIMENFSLGAAFNVNKYTLSNLPQPFHKPAMDLTLTGTYTIADKITVGSDVFFLTQRYGGLQTKTGYKTFKLDPIIDLNLNAAYRFANIPGLRAHLELKNILGSKYQEWNFYRTRGFQVMGGVSYSFL